MNYERKMMWKKTAVACFTVS